MSMEMKLKIFSVTGFFTLCLFLPATGLAGSSPVVTVGDSSSGGTINYDQSLFSYGGNLGSIADEILAGGSPSIEISPGVTVTVSSLATAVNNGSLGQDQIANGFGRGGSIVTLSEQETENVKQAAYTATVVIDGENITPFDALKSLSVSEELVGLRVAMPGNVKTDLSSILSNVTVALTSVDRAPTMIGTALNDAAIALSQAIKDEVELSGDLQSSAISIALLLDSIRSGA